MSDLQKIDATVFVYRHRITGIVRAHYIDTARNFEEAAEWEHVATLNPRAWIEFNYSVAEQRDELLAALKDASEEYKKLPHSLGYPLTHCNKWDELIAKVESEK